MEFISLKGETMVPGFLRHVRNCNNVELPGARLPFRIRKAQVGWVKPDLAMKLGAFPEISAGPDGVTLADATALAKQESRHLAKRQLTWFRREQEIVWLDPERGANDALALFEKFFRRE